MTKSIFLIILLFFGLQVFEGKDTEKEKQIHPTPPARVEQQEKLDDKDKELIQSIMLAILPPQEEWPSPVQKFYVALNMEDIVEPMRQDPEWVNIKDIPKNCAMQLSPLKTTNFTTTVPSRLKAFCELCW